MRSLICALTSLLAISAAASADYASVAYTGKGAGQNVRVLSRGLNQKVFAGQLHLTVSDCTVGPTLNGSWTAFSSDLFEATNKTVALFDVALGEIPETSGPTDAARASALADLYAHAAGAQLTTRTSKNLAVAFQLAVWEVVNDYNVEDANHGLDLNSGVFRATKNGGGAFSKSVRNYLAELFDSIGKTSGASLVGLGSTQYQDGIIQVPSNVIPGPGALALLALGAVLSGQRRR